MPFTKTALGDRLRTARTERGLSQTQLADIIGVRQNVISNWETGRNRVPLEKLAQLADVYGTSLDTLIREEVPA